MTLANLLPTRESGHPGREALIERRRASWDQRDQRDPAGDGRLPSGAASRSGRVKQPRDKAAARYDRAARGAAMGFDDADNLFASACNM